MLAMKNYSSLILATLFAMTSITHAKSANPSVQLTTEFEQPVLAAGQSQRTIVKISLLPDRIEVAEERPAVNLAIALDRSSSMGGDKIVQARNAALEALSLLGPRDRFSLVAYSDEAETLIESQHPLERERLAAIIRNIQSGGSTALYAGVSQAAAEIRRGRSDGAFNRLILLSDGIANKGPSSVEDLRGLSLSLAGEDISVSTVGLGSGFNEDLMTAMAEAAGRIEEAEEHFEAAYSLMPDQFGRIESHCFGCEGAFRGKRAGTIAGRVFTRMLKERPNKPSLHYLMGYLKESQGESTEALKHFKRTVELDPLYYNAWSHIRSIVSSPENLDSKTARQATIAMLEYAPRRSAGITRNLGIGEIGILWDTLNELYPILPQRKSGMYPLKASAQAMKSSPQSYRRQNRRTQQWEITTPAQILFLQNDVTQLLMQD